MPTILGRAKIVFLEFERTEEAEERSFLDARPASPSLLGALLSDNAASDATLESVELSDTGMSVRIAGRFDSIRIGARSGRQAELVPSYLEYLYFTRELSWILYISLVLGLGAILFKIFKEIGVIKSDN